MAGRIRLRGNALAWKRCSPGSDATVRGPVSIGSTDSMPCSKVARAQLVTQGVRSLPSGVSALVGIIVDPSKMGCVYRSTREAPLVPAYLHGRGSGSPGVSPLPPYPLKSMGLEDLPTWGPHVLMLENRGAMPMRMLMEPIENHTP